MFYKTGEPLITLHRKANRNGKFYYFGTLESVSWYLFSSGQFWFGMSEKSRNGDLMIKSNFNNKLVKFGIWAKQSDGTIVIFCDVKGGKYGLVGEYNKKSICDCKSSSYYHRGVLLSVGTQLRVLDDRAKVEN
jgi:hypothetical protein